MSPALNQLLHKQNKTPADLQNLVAAFSTLPLISNMDADLAAVLVSTFSAKSVPANTFLFHKGEKGEKVYLLLKGRVAVLIPHSDSPLQRNQSMNAGNAASRAQTNMQLMRRYVTRMLYYKPTPHEMIPAPSNQKPKFSSDEEREKFEYQSMFDLFRYKKYPRPKLTKAKAMMGYWFVQNILKKVDTSRNSRLATIANRYGSKSYFHNLILTGLPELGTQPPGMIDALFPSLKSVVELKPLSSFGEIALLDPNSTRTASVICLEPCQFAVVTSRDATIAGWIGPEKQREKEKSETLRGFPTFNYWFLKESKIPELIAFVRLVKAVRGDKIYSRSDKKLNLVILAVGDVEITLKRTPVVDADSMESHSSPPIQYRRRVSGPYLIGVEELLMNLSSRVFEAEVLSVNCKYYEISLEVVSIHVRTSKNILARSAKDSSGHFDHIPAFTTRVYQVEEAWKNVKLKICESWSSLSLTLRSKD